MKAIIIDDSREGLARTRRALAGVASNVEVTEYDPEQRGAPPPSFNWALYDVLLIAQNLGGIASGLDWIRRYADARGFPPAILLAEEADVYLGSRAIREGASDILLKRDLDTERLTESLARLRGVRPLPKWTPLKDDARIMRSVASLGATPQGDRIGYRFQRLIGQGAHSRLYLAEPAGGGQPLVLKIVDLANVVEPHLLQRFIREAELISAIDSPQVVRFIAHGFTEHYGYIAMEFLPEGDLKQRIVAGLTPEEAIGYFRQIAQGLSAIHARGIVHRDLKPGNILFASEHRLALADFGISRRLEEHSELTRVDNALGTPNYVSPEQASGAEVDHRTDFYSAGIILFEMLTRRKPFRADNSHAMIHQHLHAPIPLLPAGVAQYQPLIDRLLAKQPADRYDNAEALLAAMDAVSAEAGARA